MPSWVVWRIPLTRNTRCAAAVRACVRERGWRERERRPERACSLRDLPPAPAREIAAAGQPGPFPERSKTRATTDGALTGGVRRESASSLIPRLRRAGPSPRRARRRRTKRAGRVLAPPRRVRPPSRVPGGGLRLALGLLPAFAPPARRRCGAAHRCDARAAPVSEAGGCPARWTAVPVHRVAGGSGVDRREPRGADRARGVRDEGGGRASRRVGPAARSPDAGHPEGVRVVGRREG